MLKLMAGIVIGIAIPGLALVVAALTGTLPVSAVDEPSSAEVTLARGALKASLARAAAALTAPPIDAPGLEAGKKLYADNCSGCHGEAGKPSVWGTTAFFPRVPQLMRDRTDLTREQAYLVVKKGIRYSGMGAWEKLMADADIWRVAAFVTR